MRSEERKRWLARRAVLCCTGCAGWCLSASGANATRGSAGRRTGSVSAAHVASFPGAGSEAVSTWRARDNSPCLTLAQARCRFCSAGGRVWASRAGLFARRAARSSWSQSPRRNAAARPARPCEPCWLVRATSIRGASKNSFHALAAPSLSAPPLACSWRICRSACTSAPRTAARMNGGASCSVGAGWRNSDSRSTPSSANHVSAMATAAGSGQVGTTHWSSVAGLSASCRGRDDRACGAPFARRPRRDRLAGGHAVSPNAARMSSASI